MKSFFNSYGWLIWASIVALMVLLFWFAFLSDSGLNSLFSSDALYLPSLYRDIVQDGYTLNGWILNQASNFFPDMLLFFLLNAIFGNFIAATFWYSLIQYFAIILIFYLIFKQLKPAIHPSAFAPAIFLFASYLFLFFIDHRVWESALLNHNSYHNSAFIMALISIYLFLKYLDTKSWKTLIAVLVLSMLSGACDRLFFICFSIPVSLVVVTLYCINKDWKTLTKFLVTVALGVFLAIVLWILFQKNPYFSLTKAYGELTPENIRSSWVIFSRQMYGYLTTPSFIFVLTWLSVFSFLATLVYVFKKIIKLIKEKKYADKMFVFQLFVLFFTPIVLFAPILSGSYGGFDTMRYNYFPFFLLPFNAVVLASNWLNSNKLFRIIINATFTIFMVGYLLINCPVREFGKGLERFFNFYPEKARIIDDYFLDDGTYKYGTTDDYWMAKQVTMFSKKGVRLYCAFDDGIPWLHVANKHWFIDNYKGKHAQSEFTFLLWTKGKDIPEILKTMNDTIYPVELSKWYLFEVKPYRFLISGTQFRVESVLIDTSSNEALNNDQKPNKE
jgi:hypothetical protein